LNGYLSFQPRSLEREEEENSYPATLSLMQQQQQLYRELRDQRWREQLRLQQQEQQRLQQQSGLHPFMRETERAEILQYRNEWWAATTGDHQMIQNMMIQEDRSFPSDYTTISDEELVQRNQSLNILGTTTAMTHPLQGHPEILPGVIFHDESFISEQGWMMPGETILENQESRDSGLHREGASSRESVDSNDPEVRAYLDDPNAFISFRMRVLQNLQQHIPHIRALIGSTGSNGNLGEQEETRAPGLSEDAMNELPRLKFFKILIPEYGDASLVNAPPRVETDTGTENDTNNDTRSTDGGPIHRTSSQNFMVKIPSKSSAVDFICQSTCSICLGDYEEDAVLVQLPECGHAFDETCIKTWLKETASCPVCRHRIADPRMSST